MSSRKPPKKRQAVVRDRYPLAHMLHNRTCAAWQYTRATGEPHPQFGDGTWSAACRTLAGVNAPFDPAAERAFDRAFLRSLASLCLVLAGDVADPTRGATLFHRHDEAPGWADLADPTALIGSLIFYVAPEPAEAPKKKS